MADLDIKKLAKGMSLEDKAKLLFADRNKQAETGGLERILTGYEEDELIKDARKNNQIDRLNSLYDLFNLANLLLTDIQTAYLNFMIAKGKLEWIITGIRLNGQADDIISQMIYDIATEGVDRDEMDENKELQKKIDKKAQELRKKYSFEKGLGAIFNHYELSEDEKKAELERSYFSVVSFKNRQPNELLQHTFVLSVDKAKKLREVIFQLEFIIETAGFNFLSDSQQNNLLYYEAEIQAFVKLDGLLTILKLYKEDVFKKDLPKQLVEPRFIVFVEDVEKALALTDEEKEKARAQIKNLLKKL